MSDPVASFFNALRSSPLLRVLLIGFLVLLLQIPIAMIDGLIAERQSTRREAIQDVTGAWGKEQVILGPALVVPFIQRWSEEIEGGRRREHTAVQHATFLPDTLRVEGKLEAEVRYRGIFRVAVYRLALRIEGRFDQPGFEDWEVGREDILWDRAQLWLRISDARAIRNQAALVWNGREVGFAPGTGDFANGASGIHAPLKESPIGGSREFSIPLTLNGSVAFSFAPFGRETSVDLASDWVDPSFRGSWLPTRRDVGDAGFTAEWRIPSLGRNYPQRWSSLAPTGSGTLDASVFGVELLNPVDPYRMTLRSVKYAALFLLFTFLSLWLFEVLARQRIHSVQYLMVGAAMCLFYLLELSLAEHLGLGIAYSLASVSVVAMITLYCAAVLRGLGRASVVGAVVAGLYAYLYVLLNNQDYALLVGAVGLFLILAAVMYLTRRTDWDNPGS